MMVMRERYIAVWVRQHGCDGYEMSGVRLKKWWVCKVAEGMGIGCDEGAMGPSRFSLDGDRC